jgi:hypothetical protein
MVGLRRAGEAEKRGCHACGDMTECDELYEQKRARQDMTISDTGEQGTAGRE